MILYRCNNCLWEGKLEDMDDGNGFHSCPTCCAEFYPDEHTVGPWSMVVTDDDINTDYGDFDESSD